MRALARRWIAVLFGALGAVGAVNSAQADKSPSTVIDFAHRAALMREHLDRLQARQPAEAPPTDAPRELAQWFNFPNWPNFNNWSNFWNNWGNFYR